MAAELLIAPPACGKTHTCVGRILQLKAERPLAQVWVIVPDQLNSAYFRRRLSEAGGGMGISVGTFRKFYVETLERSGTFVPVVTPALEHRLVQEVIAEVSGEGNLQHYEAIKLKPGFINALQDAFAELRGALVRPERFTEYTRFGSPAQRELAALYARFLTRLNKLNWIDMEGQSWLAVDALENQPEVVSDVELVVVDGFTSFTGARRRFLDVLSRHTGSMLITLPGQPGSNRPVHNKSHEVIASLQHDLHLEIHELPDEPHLDGDKLHLEQHVLDPGVPVKLPAKQEFFYEVRSQTDEARETLRWIKALHLRQGVPLDACAIFAANLETYQPLLRAAADEFGMQVHFTRPDPLAESPAMLALLTLLNLPAGDYGIRALMNTLRSPYFDFGLEPQAIDELERISRQAVIVSGRSQWEDAWRMLEKRGIVLEEELDEERQRKDLTAGIDIPALHKAMDGFWELFDTAGSERYTREWVTWLEDTLEKLHFFERLNNERDLAACKALDQALKAMILSESVVGSRPVMFNQFVTDLQGGMNGARLEEPAELRRGAVLVGRMVESRGTRYQAVALLGLSEGLFPVVENPDPFLAETLRAALGLEPRLGREQASIFYQALTRTDEYLLITRPYLSEDGEAWEPSPYWQAASGLFEEGVVKKQTPGEIRPQADAASTQEVLFWGVQQGRNAFHDDPGVKARCQELDHAGAVLAARRARRANSPYEGDARLVAQQLTAHYSPEYTWSASRFEDYGSCPYKFFVNTVMKLSLKEVPEPGLDAAQRGSIYHRILELVYRNAGEEPTLESILALLEDTAAKVFLTAPKSFGFRPSALWQIEKEEMVKALRKTVTALEERSEGWTPYRFEQKFGIKGTPLLVLEKGGEAVNLRGVIDRVDRNTAGMLRVIDYKSGGSMTLRELIRGERLQLPIYGLAAQTALEMGNVAEGFYWIINQGKESALRLVRAKIEGIEGPEAAYLIATSHIFDFLAEIRNGVFPPHVPSGGCPEYCPAVQWCWRYQPGF